MTGHDSGSHSFIAYMQQKQDYASHTWVLGEKKTKDKNLVTQCAKLQKKIYTPLRQDNTGKTLFFLHALVNFEMLGYMAFHNVLFQTSGTKTSKIHLNYYFIYTI